MADDKQLTGFDLNLTYLPFSLKLRLIWALIESMFGQELHIFLQGTKVNEADPSPEVDQSKS